MPKDSRDKMDDFDETNGLAPGLDGDANDPDSAGNNDPDDTGHGVLGDLVQDVTTGFQDRDDDAHSDEGR